MERFSEHSREKESGKEEVEKIIERLILENCHETSVEIDDEQKGYMLSACIASISGFCGLEKPLSDESVEEVSIIGIGKPAYVYVRNSGWKKTNLAFTDEEALIDVINRTARGMGRRITFQKPKLNAVLPDGSRLHATIPPLSEGEVTIRKFKSSPFAPWELAQNNTLGFEALAFLWAAMQFDLRVLVCGNTASGKTTTLNALFLFVPKSERVIIFEETPEIKLLQPHFARLVSNEELGIGMKEIVWDSLRMRPDRVVVGEVRTKEEVAGLIETMLAGQAKGSYATMHAQSAQECLQRMKNLGVSEMDCKSIDLIVCQRRISSYDAKSRRMGEKRRVTEICEVKKQGELGVERLFYYDEKKDGMVGDFSNSLTFGRISSFFGMDRKNAEKEIGKRREFLEGMAKKKPKYEDSFALVQKFAYGE